MYWYARGWQYIYAIKNKLLKANVNYGGRLVSLLLFTFVAISIALVPALQSYVEPYFLSPERFDKIRSLFLTLGGAMIGATAIAFSLIMFAMQVNVERMPHGLFKKFSSDIRLLGAFVATFSLAILIATLSLIPDNTWVLYATVTTIWSSVFIILLFILAYRRALDLISPTKQLGLVVEDVKLNFRKWDKAAKRTIPIFQNTIMPEKDEVGVRHDMERLAYFMKFPNWTFSADKAIFYCITFSRRYAEQGDHEVSSIALNGVVAINAEYIKTKGRTFFSTNPLIDNPWSSDKLLNNTLEHLRQNIQIGISRKDEQFIEQNLQCLFQLMGLYLTIDYGDQRATKSHAHLASSYLTNSVERIVPHDMADVLIEGIDLLGKAAVLIAHYDEPQYITDISKKLSLIACTGTINKNYEPLAQVAVLQLATMTFELLRSKERDISIAIKEVRNDVKSVAEIYLNTSGNDSPLSNIQSINLAPYYSGTRHDSLFSWLTDLAKALSDAKEDDENAQRVIRHIVDWADQLYQTEKELLLLSIEKRSPFTFDLVHWVTHIAKLLLAISCSEACDEYSQEKLRNSAIWLMNVLSWIPDDAETIRYIETYRIADNIFESSVDAQNLGCEAEALEFRKLLLKWTHKAGKYQTGWASLETAYCGLACLNIILELPDQMLFGEVDLYILGPNAPSIEVRSSASNMLNKEAEKYRGGYGHGEIEMAMTQVNQERLRALLHGVADHLSPEAAH